MIIEINKSFTKLGSNIIFTVGDALEGVANIITFKDSVTGLSNIARIRREFSVTYDEKTGEDEDKREWSIWYKTTEPNLNGNINFEGKFWLKFKYIIVEKYDTNPIKINNIELTFTLKEGEDSPLVEDEIYDVTNAIDFNKDANIGFNDLGESYVQIHNDVNNFLNREYGVDVLYFKTEPDIDTVDSFLNEYSLHHVTNPGGTCIKVVVPENEIPDPKPEYDEWGINFDAFEVHINKDYFEEVFGAGKKPRDEDFMFFSVYNRMYYINSNYLDRGVQGSATNYIINLKKYDDNTSILKDEETQEWLESHTMSHEEVFGKKEAAEKTDIVNDQQNTIKTIADDIVRDFIHENMIIKDDCIFNNGTVLLKYRYDMNAILFNETAVRYKLSHDLLEDQSWASTQWVNIPQRDFPVRTINILNQERIDFNTLKIKFDKPIIQLKIKEYSSIIRGNDVYDLISIIDEDTVLINSRTDIDPEKLDNYSKSRKQNLHYTANDDISFSINLYNRKKLRIRLNNTLHDFDDLNLDLDTWYAPVINISNSHGYIGVYIWKMEQRGIGDPEKNSTRLMDVYKKEISIRKNSIIISKGSIPSIFGSDVLMSNIRILNRAIDYEYQSYFVGTRGVKKASVCSVIDDAEIILNLGVTGEGNLYISDRVEKREKNKLGQDERI